MRGSYTQPALVGGVVLGVLSALPLVSAGNACCCLWVIGGGLVTAYTLQQNQESPITPADGLLVGLLAGICGAVVHIALSIPITLVFGPAERAMLERMLERTPELRDIFDRYGNADREFSVGFFIVGRIVALMFWACVGAVFGAIGGVLGAAIFKKRLPPGTVDVTPQSS